MQFFHCLVQMLMPAILKALGSKTKFLVFGPVTYLNLIPTTPLPNFKYFNFETLKTHMLQNPLNLLGYNRQCKQVGLPVPFAKESQSTTWQADDKQHDFYAADLCNDHCTGHHTDKMKFYEAIYSSKQL